MAMTTHLKCHSTLIGQNSTLGQLVVKKLTLPCELFERVGIPKVALLKVNTRCDSRWVELKWVVKAHLKPTFYCTSGYF